jgi:hypothetical protein
VRLRLISDSRLIGAEFKLDADLQLCVSMRILWPNWGTKGASRGL